MTSGIHEVSEKRFRMLRIDRGDTHDVKFGTLGNSLKKPVKLATSGTNVMYPGTKGLCGSPRQ